MKAEGRERRRRRWRTRADIHELGARGEGGGGKSLGGEREERRHVVAGSRRCRVERREEEERGRGGSRKCMQAGEVQSGSGNCEGD